MITLPTIDRNVFGRYAGLSLPRHVAYPMPSWWQSLTPADADGARGRALEAHPERNLSLYFHIPFCETLCKFCACNRVIMRKAAVQSSHRVASFLEALEKEIVSGSPRVTNRVVQQIHFGGGTPTYLTEPQLEHIFRVIADHYAI